MSSDERSANPPNQDTLCTGPGAMYYSCSTSDGGISVDWLAGVNKDVNAGDRQRRQLS